ncbi:MAG: phosphocholine cytidylyltransferase family protein [Rhodospirillaceae bacterium]|nr:phosphocholine cytidylyltransferase family protein [Rhodospirillaceae bacterium]
MRAIILAAGRGHRMGETTKDKPKCLTVFNGKSLLDWQLMALRKAGINDVAIVRGYLGEKLEGFSSTFFENPHWDDTNMVRSLLCAGDWLAQFPCVISYGDIFYGADAVRQLSECSEDIAISYDPSWLALWSQRFEDPLSDAETFVLGDNGLVREIGNRATSIADIEGQYMGLLKFTPAGWAEITNYLTTLTEPQIDQLDMTSLLSSLVANEIKVCAAPIESAWGEVDSEHDLEVYTDMIERQDLVFP